MVLLQEFVFQSLTSPLKRGQGISNFLDIDVDDLFSFMERISLSINLSMPERSGIKFNVTCSAGFLSHLNIGYTV